MIVLITLIVRRIRDGQTQTDWPQDEEEAHFNHLVDLHFGARGIQVICCSSSTLFYHCKCEKEGTFAYYIKGWPQILIEVYLVDNNGRRVLYGYGSSVLPISAGYEEIEIGTWRPADQSVRGKLRTWLLDVSPELQEPESIISSATQQR